MHVGRITCEHHPLPMTMLAKSQQGKNFDQQLREDSKTSQGRHQKILPAYTYSSLCTDKQAVLHAH